MVLPQKPKALMAWSWGKSALSTTHRATLMVMGQCFLPILEWIQELEKPKVTKWESPLNVARGTANRTLTAYHSSFSSAGSVRGCLIPPAQEKAVHQMRVPIPPGVGLKQICSGS